MSESVRAPARVRESQMPVNTTRSAFGRLLSVEAKMAWRIPIGLIFGVVMPLLLLVIFGSIPAMNQPAAKLGGLTYFTVYFPILVSFVLAILALVNLPTHLATYREQGILRRLSTTPVPPSWMLAAQVVVNLVLAVLALGILVVAGTVGFGLAAPRAAGGFVLALVLTTAAMFAMGLWVSAFARSPGVANAIGQLLFYPVLFFAGLWLPRAAMPPVLRHISDYTPLGAGVQALQDSMAGVFPSVQALLVTVGYTAVFGFLAVRFFRWE